MVGISIHNEVNQSYTPIGFNFRRKGVIVRCNMVCLTRCRSLILDSTRRTLIVTVHSATMPVGFGRDGIKRKSRPLATMVQLKRNIVEVGAEDNCLAQTLIIAIARLNNDPNTSYRKDNKIRPVVRHLLETTGIDLKNGAGIPELTRFQEHLYEYKFVVYSELNYESMVYQGHAECEKRINLLFDEVTTLSRHS